MASPQELKALFRPAYRELKPNEQKTLDRIKEKAYELAVEFNPTDTREKKIALQKLEEAVMWAVKGVTR